MKLFLSILFSAVVYISSSSIEETAEKKRQRQLDAMALHARWFMHHPIISFDNDNNTFTLDFNMSSTEMNASLGMLEEEFYDTNCKDDGSNFTEYIIPAGIYAPDGVSPPAMGNGPDGKPQLKFRINTQEIADDPNIYTYYGP